MEAAPFESEFRDALQQASATFDLAPVNRVVNRWWGVAYLRLNPPTGAEREATRRLPAAQGRLLHHERLTKAVDRSPNK